MRFLGFWIMFMASAMALAFLAFSSRDVHNIASPPGASLPRDGGSDKPLTNNRKLKENSYNMGKAEVKRDLGTIDMQDYPRYDPVPSSKAAVKPGPIEHGTPLMPYIPGPTPPSPPKHDGPL